MSAAIAIRDRVRADPKLGPRLPVPYAARVRCERALLTSDRSKLEAGMRVLEALGDLDQLGRVARARGKSQGLNRS
jgi:hypothetical protein